MGMHCIRAGNGPPLLLLHGLGTSWRTWCPVLPALRRERDVVAVDLPGFGESLPLAGPSSVTTLADAVTEFLGEQHLFGIDAAGVDLGGRLAMELLARGVLRSAVVFNPVGFGTGRLRALARIAWIAQRAPGLARVMALNHLTASALFWGYAPRLEQVPRQVLVEHLEDLERAKRFRTVLRALRGFHSEEVMSRQIAIVWGRQDRVSRPEDRSAALREFPSAKVSWLDHCGHFPQWDQPEAMVRFILQGT